MIATAAIVNAAASATFMTLSLPPRGPDVNSGRKLNGAMEIAVAAVVLALIVGLIVVAPLRRGPDVDRREDERRAALEAAKEAKYREIRDAELDFRMGKLTEDDYRTTDRELRGQAIEILRELDALTPEDVAPAAR
jgi:flagellar biosynthesis/type III secretory pathway M-ring protein FliF/YscJ